MDEQWWRQRGISCFANVWCRDPLTTPPCPPHTADTLPQRLVWGGVRVVVLNRVCAQPTTCTDDGGGGTSPRLPADATTVTCVDGDWGACFR